MLSDAILLASDLPQPPDWRRLAENLPDAWIGSALSYNGKASVRKRRLPAEQVVWLVIALAIYRHKSVKEIVDSLDLALSDEQSACVTTSATTQARQRLGADVLESLFEMSALSWSTQDSDRYLLNGLNLLAMDGTTLGVADSTANRSHFGAQNYQNGKVASHPQSRGVTLMMLDTQIVRAARFGPYQCSETAMAHELIDSVPDDSLTVFDKGFLSAQLLCGLTDRGRNRHFLLPAKSNTRWAVLEGTDRDAIVQMIVSDAARKKDPSLPTTWRARAVLWSNEDTGEQTYLLTSLTDRTAFPPSQVIRLYTRRWRIETSYRELKHTMLGAELTLRSMTVEGTKQEIWGALIAYNLVRIEIAKAALQAKCEPTQISFTVALMTIQTELLMAGPATTPGKLPAMLKRIRERLVLELKVKRPGRKFDRVVKAVAQRYPEQRKSRA